ncbi:hypothetical protein [Gymnodinialimonas ulvae]|uniref:hypothetical protein n=1 Tax=Gymnodinialimonas ulvae TaxID=3126504 RepID=UPI0030B46692
MKHDLLHDMIARSTRRIEMSRAAVEAALSQKLKAAAPLQRCYAQSAEVDRQA